MCAHRNIKARSRNHYCRREAKLLHILNVCVCNLSYPACAALYRHLWLVCRALPYFSTLPHKRHDFSGKKLEHKLCVLIFYTSFVWNVSDFNPLKPELNPICYLLALLGAHHFLHVSRIRVKLLTLRLLMSYIYGAPILDVSRSHTTQHSR